MGVFWLSFTVKLDSEIFTNNIEPNEPNHPQIVVLPTEFDANNNKIADALEIQAAGLQNELVDVLIGFKHAPSQEDQQLIENIGGIWRKSYSIVYAAYVSVPTWSLEELAENHAISSISQNARSKSLLYLSSNQMGARGDAWNYQYAGLNVSGMEYFSTAVLDTGVDASHPDLESRVIGWVDFSGADAETPGDEYATYSDFGHHGTHVAGIIAGQGNSSKNGYLNVSQAGVISDINGYGWYGPAFVKPDGTSKNAIIRQSWNAAFNTWVGLERDGSGFPSGSSSTNNSQWTQAVSTAGNYTTYVGGNNQQNINYDIPYVAQSAFPLTAPADGFGVAAGIAPTSKIVGVKVLDDTGSGSADQLIDGYDWCVTNKDTYNITVINLSLGFGAIETIIDAATANLVNLYGFVVVVAAGNDGTASTKIGSPGSTREAITVGAVNRLNEVAYYSSVGNPVFNTGVVKPDVTAPGGSYMQSPSSSSRYGHTIFSTDSNFDDEYVGDYGSDGWIDSKTPVDRYPNDYMGMQGTSMATPHVSGLAQLLIQRLALENSGTWVWSQANALKIKQIICLATSESANLGLGGESDQNPALNRGAKDYTEGWGRVHAATALDLMELYLDTQIDEEIRFSTAPNGQRVAAFKLPLVQDLDYTYTLTIQDSNADMDMFLYQESGSIYGEPIEVVRSASVGLGVDEELNFTPLVAGNYYLIIRWAAGSGESIASLTAATINDAVDAYNLQFTTGGDQPWFYQTVVSNDGIDALQSGAITHAQVSWVQTTIYGLGTLNFTWRVSSESDYDFLTFYANGFHVANISGEVGWTTIQYDLDTFGPHILRWEYSKDDTSSLGSDCGWLDKIVYDLYKPVAPILQAISGPSSTGDVELKWNAVEGATSYKIFRDIKVITDLSGMTPIAIGVQSPSFINTGLSDGTYYYVVVATNAAGDSPRSNCESVTVAIPVKSTEKEKGFKIDAYDTGLFLIVSSMGMGIFLLRKRKHPLSSL
jgi:subtilisin family serine protease